MIINLNSMSTIILSILLYLIGNKLKSKVYLLNKICIPAPVIAGLLFCIINFFLGVSGTIKITMNTSSMPVFMSLFFTILGIGVSTSLVKKGGKLLFKYWVLCGVLAYSQNILAVILSKSLNIHPLLGLMCGTISMEGGHGCAAAFGTTIENLGVQSACSVGFASATLGLIIGGIIGGPISKFLIDKYNLRNTSSNKYNSNNSNKKISTLNIKLNIFTFFTQTFIILICINLGEILTKLLFDATNIILPSVVLCMFVAVVFRNLNDKLHIIKLDYDLLNFISDISLNIFLTMALMSIDLVKLHNLFGPILIIVTCQVLFIIFYSVFICFRVLGKNFDSAIMISGLIGHGLGATPSALANMSSVCEKYGYSEKAFLIVPLVGAFLLDVFTMPCIVLFINLFA